MKQAIAVVLILLAWTGPARAWPEDGHRIVCTIAWKELAPETRAWVEDLLKEDSASGFAEVHVWADAIRSDPAYDWAKPHHYVNVPAGAAGIDLARNCPPKKSCVIRAITMHIGTLRYPKASAADKAEALKFLAHFVGDVHQPLQRRPG
jgi:S1/P1 Nuclease